MDKKRPSVAATCPSAYVLKDSAATATWSATDGGSGLVGSASGTIALDTSVVGQKLASLPTGFRKDQVGNDSAAANCSYTVVYDFKGFFQPIDNGVLNKAKWQRDPGEVQGLGGNQGLNIFASGYPGSAATTCVNTAYADSVEETVSAGGSTLSYDAAAQQYVYVWKTQSAWGGTCRTLTVKLADGVTVKQANFWFAK